MKPPVRWYERHLAREAKHAEFERAATKKLLRAANRRARRSRPKPAPLPLPPLPTGWLPLADLRRALRAKGRHS